MRGLIPIFHLNNIASRELSQTTTNNAIRLMHRVRNIFKNLVAIAPKEF